MSEHTQTKGHALVKFIWHEISRQDFSLCCVVTVGWTDMWTLYIFTAGVLAPVGGERNQTMSGVGHRQAQNYPDFFSRWGQFLLYQTGQYQGLLSLLLFCSWPNWLYQSCKSATAVRRNKNIIKLFKLSYVSQFFTISFYMWKVWRMYTLCTLYFQSPLFTSQGISLYFW